MLQPSEKVRVTDFNFGFLVVWICVVLWLTYKTLSMRRRNAIEPGGWLSFRTLLGETRMRTGCRLHQSGHGQFGYLQPECRGGTLRFIAQFDDFRTSSPA